MSAMDLFEDGFPHSTREGYERGCRGSACPGKLDHGFSCADAFGRSNGDYRYQRMVADGLTPTQIAEAERPAVVEPVKPKKKKTMREMRGESPIHTTPTVTVADSEEPIVEKPKRERKKPGPSAAPIVHGTAAGYKRGCHSVEACPGDVAGVTCHQAAIDYQREYKRRRAANGGANLGQATKRKVEKPRVRKLAEAPVRVKVKCLRAAQQPPADTYKAVSFVLLRNGSVRERKFHRTWEDAMARARVLVAEHRGDAS